MSHLEPEEPDHKHGSTGRDVTLGLFILFFLALACSTLDRLP